MIVRELTLKDEKAFYQMLNEWDILFGLGEEIGFEKYLSLMDDLKNGVNLQSSEVPTTALYAFVEEVIVGKLSIRHQSHPAGHIGYGVVDKYRGKGYGDQMLKKALAHSADLGLKRVQLVCEESNIPSIKLILKNGGVLESTFEKKMRFWIDLKT